MKKTNVLSKRKSLRIAALLFVATGLVACSDEYHGEREINQDGSITYVLKSSSAIEGEHNYYYGKLVLNFPDLIKCSFKLFDKICLRRTNEQIVPSIYKSPLTKHEELIFALNYPDMELPIVNDKERWPREVTIRVSSLYEPYKVKRWYKYYAGIKSKSQGGFGALHRVEREFKCSKITNISEDFVALSKLTPEAIIATKDNPKDTNCTIYRPPRKHTHFLFREDSKSSPLAKGTCRDRGSKYDRCEFDIWLPQERIANVKFYKQHLKEFPEIYKKIVHYLADKTVIEKSFNRIESKSDGTATRQKIRTSF